MIMAMRLRHLFSRWLLLLALPLVLLFFAFFQPNTHNKADLTDRIMNDSIYSADSLKIYELENAAWHAYFNGHWDSLMYSGIECNELTKELLSYRMDSSVLKMHLLSTDWASQGKAHMGNFEEGLKECQEGLDKFIEVFGEYDIDVVHAYVGIGQIYEYMGDYEMAIFYHQKSLNVANKIFKEDHYYFGNKYSNLGNVYREIKEYDRALEYYNKMLQNYSKTAPDGVPGALRCISNTYLEKSDFNNALYYAQQSLIKENQTDKTDKLISQGDSHALLGLVHGNLKNFSKAKNHLKTALSIHTIYENINVKKELSIITDLSYLGEIYIKEQKLDSAFLFYNKAFTIAKETYGNKSLNLIPIQNKISEIFIQKREYSEALNCYQKSLNLLFPTVSKNNIFQNPSIDKLFPHSDFLTTIKLKAYASKHYFLNSPSLESQNLCLSTFRLCDNLLDKMVTGSSNPKSKHFLRKTARPFYEESVDLAYRIYVTTNDKQYLDLTFYYMEKSKSLMLLSGIQESKAKDFSGVDSELLKQERQSKKELSLYKKLVFEEELKERPDSIKLGIWYDQIGDLTQRYDSISKIFHSNHPEYYRLQHDLKAAQIEDIQKNLDKNGAMVEYMLGDSSLFTFTIFKNEVSFHSQPINDLLISQIDDFRQSLFDYKPGIKNEQEKLDDYKIFTQYASGLYQLLLAPSLSNRKFDNLLIIPDGVLGYIPFELLLQNKQEGTVTGASVDFRPLPYLFKDYAIRYEYSATLSLLEYPKRKIKNHYAGFGPQYDGDELLASRSSKDSMLITSLFEETARAGLSNLEYNQPEIKEASEAMKGKAFNGANALESNFKLEAPNSNIIHLAMHTLTNDKAPLYSQLIFSKEPDTLEDGRLHAYELYNMKFNSNLAVLSACNTGGGKLQKGEGIMSLSRAFKYAGCPNIVMSLWKADDLSTKTIMTSFFKNLKTGKSKTIALQQARIHYLENAAEQYTHPYYWGAFVLIGDDQPVKMRNNRIWWLLTGGFLLSILFIGYRKRLAH